MNTQFNRSASIRRTFSHTKLAVAVQTCFALVALPVLGTDESLNQLRTNAEKGVAQAQNELGEACRLGQLGLATNYVEALKWYRLAAEQNYAAAQCNLGSFFRDGLGVVRDPVEAVKWYRKAAGQNNARAEANLGSCYLFGLGVPKDPAEGVKWLLKAAKQGDAGAQGNLGVCYAYGLGVAKDESAAVNLLRQAAVQNHVEAQYQLGTRYWLGSGVSKDPAEAVIWHRRAAEQNHAVAQCNLGTFYERGDGVKQDPVEAVKWYRRAAGQNDAAAQCNLGVCYSKGFGVEKDEVEAVKWYRRAAEQNDAEAQNNLSLCYEHGFGVAQDWIESYKWSLLAAAQGKENARKSASLIERRLTQAQRAEGQKRAGDFKPPEATPIQERPVEVISKSLAELQTQAETGNPKAQHALAKALYAGQADGAKNAVVAVKWFRQAAEQNFAPAQSNLADCFEGGDGVAKYELKAYLWNLLAAAQGDERAKRSAFRLELLLSPEQVQEGKRMADDWLERRKTSQKTSE